MARRSCSSSDGNARSVTAWAARRGGAAGADGSGGQAEEGKYSRRAGGRAEEEVLEYSRRAEGAGDLFAGQATISISEGGLEYLRRSVRATRS